LQNLQLLQTVHDAKVYKNLHFSQNIVKNCNNYSDFKGGIFRRPEV
jgi:hypothetical protein